MAGGEGLRGRGESVHLWTKKSVQADVDEYADRVVEVLEQQVSLAEKQRVMKSAGTLVKNEKMSAQLATITAFTAAVTGGSA